MSTEPEQARKIAERVSKRIASNPAVSSRRASPTSVSAELSSVRTLLNELQEKLARLEEKLETKENGVESNSPNADSAASDRRVPLTHSPWLAAGVNATPLYPSEEKFGVEEATVSELVDFFEKEKTCSVEPGGKPCDHCAMCSSRGF